MRAPGREGGWSGEAGGRAAEAKSPSGQLPVRKDGLFYTLWDLKGVSAER